MRFAGPIVLVLTLSTVPAAAHTAGDWYDIVGPANERFPWDQASDTTYAFSSGSTWGAGWKDAIRIADSAWNSALGTTLFVDLANEEVFPGTDCDISPFGEQMVRRGQAEGNALAITQKCVRSDGVYARWWITIDASYTWHTGSGQAPSDEQHLRGVMTHEFGHATGFGSGITNRDHFNDNDEPSACTSSASTRATMCTRWGTTWEDFQHQMSTLEDHDKHTFLSVY